jgi:hypothetical protein
MLNDFNKIKFNNFFNQTSRTLEVNRIYPRSNNYRINNDKVISYVVSDLISETYLPHLDSYISNLKYSIARCNLVARDLANYYSVKHDVGLSASREIVAKIFNKVFDKHFELFESEIEKKIFVLMFKKVINYSNISVFTDRVKSKKIAYIYGIDHGLLIQSLHLSERFETSSYLPVPSTTIIKKAGRTGLRRTGMIGVGPSYYKDVIISNNIVFYKKDDSYAILAVLYLDESKINFSNGFETKDELLEFYLYQRLPNSWFKVFIDIDVLLNPPESCITLIRNLKREILDFKGEVVLGDGRKEFVDNFKISKLKTFKTLADKLNFSKKIIDEINQAIPSTTDYEHLKLDNTVKVLEKYNTDVEKVIAENKKVKEETKIVVETIVPDNLDELMAFAELISFEPNEQPQPAVDRQQDEDEDLDDEEYEEDNEETSSLPFPTYNVAVDAVVPITPDMIRETLNDLTRNDNS